MTLQDLKNNWRDEPEQHKWVHESCVWFVNRDEKLKSHRDYVEQNIWGFGERSFWWIWKLILKSLPDNPKLLEIGTFKGATISLWKLLRPDADVYAITPLDDTGFEWSHEPGYYADSIKKIHDDFKLPQPTLIVGKSNEINVVQQAMSFKPFDIAYVDGGHDFETALWDLHTYAEMVKVGGYLVIDDCCCDFKEPFGYFQGIQSVQDAFDEWSKSTNDFEFIGNVVHLRVMRRIK